MQDRYTGDVGDFAGWLREDWEPALAAVAAFGKSGGSPDLDEPQLLELPEESWRGNDERIRFVQFAFERDWFCMDLPRQTLSFDEALEAIWLRQADSANGLIPSIRHLFRLWIS